MVVALAVLVIALIVMTVAEALAVIFIPKREEKKDVLASDECSKCFTCRLQTQGPIIQLLSSFNKISLYYQGLPSCVKRMVAGLGFDGIIASLTYGSYTSSQAAMCALIERWMDTTHTFHLPFGEMIVTPLDFAAITGLSFSGEPILFSGEACESVVARYK